MSPVSSTQWEGVGRLSSEGGREGGRERGREGGRGGGGEGGKAGERGSAIKIGQL